jgi:hypothetical protein
LTWRGQDRLLAKIDLAEHESAGASGEREGAQKVAIETAQPRTERILPERNLGLLDGRWKHHVDPDHACAAFDDGGEDAADLAGPGDGRGALEGGGPIAFLVESDDDRR